MLRYIGRRLLQTIPVFFGATFLIFAMVYLMPGDPVAALGGDRGLSEAAAAQIRAQYNLDKPFWASSSSTSWAFSSQSCRPRPRPPSTSGASPCRPWCSAASPWPTSSD